MKNLKISGLLHAFLLLMILALILGCKRDDDPENPGSNVFIPDAEFTYQGYDSYSHEPRNDYEAPATFRILFSSLSQEHDYWGNIEIDYGNGVTAEFHPTHVRNGSKVPYMTYYRAGTYEIKVKVTGREGGVAEQSKTIDILPLGDLDKNAVQGKWSIIEEKKSHSGGTSLTQVPLLHELIEFWENGFNRFSLLWSELEYGEIELTGKEIKLKSYGGDTLGIIRIDSFYRKDLSPYVSAKTTIIDNQLGSVDYEMQLRNVDDINPGYVSLGINHYDWSIIEEERSIYEYSDERLNYTKLVETLPKETIPMNHLVLTMENLINDKSFMIDSWSGGDFKEITNYRTMTPLHMTILLDDIEEPFMVFDPLDDYFATIDELTLTTSLFYDDNGSTVREETKTKIKKHTGSEVVIGKSSLVGSWEIMTKAETIDSQPVDSASSNTPDVGHIFTLNADGSAVIGGGGGESWYMLNNSHFVFLPAGGEELLIHLNSYSPTTQEMEIMTITHDTEDDYKLVYGLLKQ